MVVSVGAEFSFTVLQNNNVYNIGETISNGIAEFNFNCDFDARKSHCGNKNIAYKTIKIVSNGGFIVCEADKHTERIEIDLQKNHWYRAELWGTINGKEQPLAITSPVYAV